MDDSKLKQGNIGILDPTRLCKATFSVHISKDGPIYRAKSQKEIKKIIQDAEVKKKFAVATYIGRAMHNFVEAGKTDIRAPYHFE